MALSALSYEGHLAGRDSSGFQLPLQHCLRCQGTEQHLGMPSNLSDWDVAINEKLKRATVVRS